MPNALESSEYFADPATGYFLSKEHQRIAEIIHDYNPALSLVWVPNAQRTAADMGKEFAVVESIHGRQSVVFYIDKNEMDHRVLERIFAGDIRKHDVLKQIEISEKAKEIMDAKREEDLAAERRDFIATVAASPLHTYVLPSGRKAQK